MASIAPTAATGNTDSEEVDHAKNKVYERTISVQNFFDVTGANDLVLTTT
jgi:hypothetical protein